jgi:hypothetical protein
VEKKRRIMEKVPEIRENDFFKVEKALNDNEKHACAVLHGILLKRRANRPQLMRFVSIFVEKRLNSDVLAILEAMDE